MEIRETARPLATAFHVCCFPVFGPYFILFPTIMWHVLTDCVTKTLDGFYRAWKCFSPSDPSVTVRLFPSSPDAEPWQQFGAQVSPLHKALSGFGVNKEAWWSAPASHVDIAEGCLTVLVGRCSWRKDLRMAPEISRIDLEKPPSGAFAACWLHCGDQRSLFLQRKEAEE